MFQVEGLDAQGLIVLVQVHEDRLALDSGSVGIPPAQKLYIKDVLLPACFEMRRMLREVLA